MNKHLDDAILGVGKLDAIMYAMETDLQVPDEFVDREVFKRFANLFYVLWDELNMVSESLDKLAEDSVVVDVIRAAKESRGADGTLKT